MAYAVLSSLTQTIHQILSHHQQFPISVEGKQLIESLSEKIILLQDFLTKFARHATSIETRIWNAANQAEDIIEHFMDVEIQLRNKPTGSAAAGGATDVEYDFRELKVVAEEINSVAEEAADIVKLGDPPSLQSELIPLSRPAPTVESVMVGLEDNVKKIKDLVLSGPSEVQIIPITGMGGIGKTTLARKIYDDPLVKERFPVRAWVTVSQDYKPKIIFADLYKISTASKFLVVVDDLWSEEAWDDMKKALGDPRNANGSRIVVTTRNESVAFHVNPSSSSVLHKMNLLRPEESWALIQQKVFPNKTCPYSMEKIGRDIATNCGGLPLAVVLVAGILSNIEESQHSWEEVAKDARSAIVKSTDEFSRIISLSYTYLPLYLRPCFLYMGGFPEDHEIRLSRLIKLWTAEGFVRDEDEAEQYLNNLMTRSLAMVATIKSNGKVKSCNIHDMVRDLSIRKALDENYERRVSTAHLDLRYLATAYASTLRSVTCFQPTESSLLCLRKLRLLRVLDVVDTYAYSLPASVFELFHLRYLAFGCPMDIPTGISKLQNLRTLIIRPSKRSRKYATKEVYLPLEIWMMPLLTNLVSSIDLLPNPEGAVPALGNLLTLSVVEKLICSKEMMRMIPNVKKLGITYSVDKYQEDYQLENLALLHQLEKLTLVLKAGDLVRRAINPVFPQTLRKLTLSGCRFCWDYMSIFGSLPELQVLKLKDHACEGGKWETDEDQFPELVYLHIDASDLKEWTTKSSHFPKLKRMVIYRCSSLSEISDDFGDVLQLIEVDHASESLVQCVKEIQAGQQEGGNDFLRVNCIYYSGF